MNALLEQLNALQPIAEDAVELRVDPGMSWPEDLEGMEGPTGLKDTALWSAREALEEARNVFASYRATRSINAKDERLTAQGALELDAEWVKENMDRLETRAERIRQGRRVLEKNIENMLGELTDRPDDPMEFEELKEIRGWLRTLPEAERTDKIDFLVRHGDMKALRAVLTAPAYLTGVDENVIALIREEAARRADPQRYARFEGLKKGYTAAERAIDGVRRFLAQDTAPEALGDRAARQRRGPRAVGAA
jgi:hypothetical protein